MIRSVLKYILELTKGNGMKEESRYLKHAKKRIEEAFSLSELFRTYDRLEGYIAEHGSPGEIQKLWQAYYSHIGRCS